MQMRKAWHLRKMRQAGEGLGTEKQLRPASGYKRGEKKLQRVDVDAA
jgi:hypothetical protein